MNKFFLTPLAVLALMVFASSCKKNVAALSKLEDNSSTISSKKVQNNETMATTDVYIYPNNTKSIDNKVFGINNEWRSVTSAEFPSFSTSLNDLGCTLLRFPGGWESEAYDWSTNTTPGWSKAPAIPGATPAQAKGAVANTTFVVRTGLYMNNPTTANLNLLKEEAYNLVLQYGSEVKSWEIGNEWWLQWAGGVDRATKLTRYATIARAIAKRIKDANSSVEVYVTGQWQVPTDFSTIKSVFDENSSWANVNGIDVHVYTGDNGSDEDYHNIQTNFNQIKSLTGKSKIIASEWAATKGSTGNKRGLRAANIMVLAWHNMVRGGLTSACYWPAPNIAWGIGLMSDDTNYNAIAVGQAFKWLATSMKDFEAATSDNIEMAVSNDKANKEITVIIPTQELSNQSIRLRFSNTDVTNLLSAQAMYMSNPDAPNSAATIANISVDNFNATNNTVTVTANPLNAQGQPLRGPSYELIKIVVKYQ